MATSGGHAMRMESESPLVDLADHPAFVFSVYALILTPLAVYVYHDILDTRWRPVWRLVRFLFAYMLLYLLSASGLIVYIVVQIVAKDYKEVGASFLAFILGTYGAWKLVRLGRIINAHRLLVTILQKIDSSLCQLTGLPSLGLEYHLFKSPTLSTPPTTLQRDNWREESRHDYISSSLFDDDYPGEAGARIKWLTIFGGKINVLQEDADECASRVALWMRLVLRRPRSEPWRLLTSTSPLVQRLMYRTSIGEALRALMTHGSEKLPPANVNPNPAELLLNNGSLAEAGIGFFWIGSEMGAEEMAEVLSEMPPRWMRGVSQNGKQLMFELVMSLILCEMPSLSDESLRDILMLPILKWDRHLTDMQVWKKMSVVCCDAVATLMPQVTMLGTTWSVEQIKDDVQAGVFHLKDATSGEYGAQGDIIGLTIMELIRAAYRSGFLAEQILGQGLGTELDTIDESGGTLRLYKAEIVTGLFSVLYQLGQHDSDDYREYYSAFLKKWKMPDNVENIYIALQHCAKREMEASFNLSHTASSKYWYLGPRDTRCEDPHVAFASLASTARELAPLTLLMIQNYKRKQPNITLSPDHGNPEKYRQQWFSWTRSQALEVSGSTEAIGAEVLNMT